MKRTLLIALLLIPFLGMSQTTKAIDGFLGIKFGSSKAAVLEALKNKGATLGTRHSQPDLLDFNNVQLGHRTAIDFYVKFIDDKAYFAEFIFKAEEDPKTIDYYNELVNNINEIYGKGKSTRQFRSPYKYGDGDEIIAIEGGYADMFTDWQSGTNSIQVTTTSKLKIALIYQDDILQKQADDKQKSKEKSDF